MGSYRLLKKCGNYVEHNEERVPTTYKAGDVVSSKYDLAEIFPDKFVQIDKIQGNGNVKVTQPDIPVPGSSVKNDSSETKKD